jgi:multimeric flavodoxin WrbA
MKLLMISGSRNPKGKTASMADALLRGAASAGAESERFFLPSMTIERCRQCDERGWGDCIQKGTCVIEDDFAGLVEKVRAADAVVFANPVYFSDLSESLRAFLDRLRRITRHDSAKPGIQDKAAVGVCVAGGGGGGAPACVERLQQVLATCGFDVLDVVPVRRQNMDLKAEVLETTGRWLARRPPA